MVFTRSRFLLRDRNLELNCYIEHDRSCIAFEMAEYFCPRPRFESDSQLGS